MSIIIQYLILAFFVILFSIKLSYYVDALDKKTNLSGAFIGGVLLAAVTSLPELFTSITAVLFLNSHRLVQGNVFGSNIFNLTIISICVIIYSKKFKNAIISKTHIGTLIFSFIMFGVCLLGMYIPDKYIIPLGFTKINIATIIIVVLYVLNLNAVKSDDSCSNEEPSNINLTVRQIVIRFILLAICLVGVSILLTQVTDKLAEKFELGKTAAGAIFLGVATSLPELTSSLNLARLKNFNASIGNIVGSNLFNFTILCFGDILYGDNIYTKDTGAITIIVLAMISSIFTMFTILLKKKKIFTYLFSLLSILCYALSVIFAI